MKSSILDRLVSPLGWAVVALLVFSMLPLVAPLFMFEVPDLTQTMVDGCTSNVELSLPKVDCERSPWLRLIAVAHRGESLYLALSPQQGDEGDSLWLTFPSSEYRFERGTNGIWAVSRQDEPDEATLGVVSKTQNGFEILSLTLPVDLDRWAASTSRSRTPPTGSYANPVVPYLTDAVALPSWAPWVLLALLLLWGYRIATPSRVVRWVRWLIFLGLVGWALSTTRPHLDESLGRFATSSNYPILVPIGFVAFMLLGVPWLAYVVARAVANRLPRWKLLSDAGEPRPAELLAVKVMGAGLLTALIVVALLDLVGAIARLFPGFTV